MRFSGLFSFLPMPLQSLKVGTRTVRTVMVNDFQPHEVRTVTLPKIEAQP